MLVKFTTTKEDDSTSPLMLRASNLLGTHILESGLPQQDKTIRMLFGRQIQDGMFEFVWDFGIFSASQVEEEVDFPGLLAIEEYEPNAPTPPPLTASSLPDTVSVGITSSSSSIIANVGRIWAPPSSDGDEGVEEIPL